MYLTYELQFPIFHAKLMIIGLWLVLYASLIWGKNLILLKEGVSSKFGKVYDNYAVPLDFFILFYAFFMLKGVSIKKQLLSNIFNIDF